MLLSYNFMFLPFKCTLLIPFFIDSFIHLYSIFCLFLPLASLIFLPPMDIFYLHPNFIHRYMFNARDWINEKNLFLR